MRGSNGHNPEIRVEAVPKITSADRPYQSWPGLSVIVHCALGLSVKRSTKTQLNLKLDFFVELLKQQKNNNHFHETAIERIISSLSVCLYVCVCICVSVHLSERVSDQNFYIL